MATPGIGSGVVERVKPQRTRKNVCWRLEASLGAASSVFTPVFDCVADGRPLSETELAATAGSGLVVVPSPHFFVTVVMPTAAGSTNPGARLQVFAISDTGGQDSPFTWYVQPRSGTGAHFYRYTMTGRRCQFRILNTPLGPVAAAVQTFKMTVVNEG